MLDDYDPIDLAAAAVALAAQSRPAVRARTTPDRDDATQQTRSVERRRPHVTRPRRPNPRNTPRRRKT
jgi:hypothetical protein